MGRSFKASILRAAIAAIVCALAIVGTASAEGDRARFVFVGDIMAHMPQVDGARRSDGTYDFSPTFRRIVPLLYGGYAVGNLETVFGGAKSKYTGYPMFNTPDELADAIKGAGFRAVTLANNHILDRREAGLVRTMDVLDAAGIAHVGASRSADPPEPLIVEHGGVRAAIINFTYGTNVPPKQGEAAHVVTIKSADIRSAAAAARAASPDLIIACMHWGDEYVLKPRKRDVETAELCLAEGVDLIVGTHPHVLQPIEVRTDGERAMPIAWSLGNFVSNQRPEPRERSAVLAVDVERADDGSVRIARVSVAPTWVSSRKIGGRRLHEIVYAGTGGSFAHTGLPKAELDKARKAGRQVLEFLGATDEPDEQGFYTIWTR